MALGQANANSVTRELTLLSFAVQTWNKVALSAKRFVVVYGLLLSPGMTTSRIPAPQPICPSCRSEYVKRVSRVGLAERFLSLFYTYPFCCQLCGYRFKVRQRGVTYTRIKEDRREYYRWSADFPITFRAGTKGVAGSIIDISMGGCAFHTEALMLEGIILQLDLQLPHETTPLKIEAAVVRSVRRRLASVEFLRIESGERERLKGFVRSLMLTQMNSNDVEDSRLVA